MPLGTEVGLGPGHIVLDGDSAPPKKGTARQFLAHVYCGQTVAHLTYCWALVKIVMLLYLWSFVVEVNILNFLLLRIMVIYDVGEC